MKIISTKPNLGILKVTMPKIKSPQKPTAGIRMPRVAGVISPLRFNK